MKILLLEDDFRLSKEVKTFFESKQVECDCVADGLMVLKQFKAEKYDLVIMDINVPGQNGMEACRDLRSIDKKIPIIMLTALGEIDDKLSAFNKGADDYLVKPFHFEELFARVNSLYKRKDVPLVEDEIIVGDMNISPSESTVFRNGTEIKLTPKEFQLLMLLAQANGKIVSKQYISEKLWDYLVETNQNTIEVYINMLRKKIDKDHLVKLIHTKVGFGYYLKAE